MRGAISPLPHTPNGAVLN